MNSPVCLKDATISEGMPRRGNQNFKNSQQAQSIVTAVFSKCATSIKKAISKGLKHRSLANTFLILTSAWDIKARTYINVEQSVLEYFLNGRQSLKTSVCCSFSMPAVSKKIKSMRNQCMWKYSSFCLISPSVLHEIW